MALYKSIIIIFIIIITKIERVTSFLRHGEVVITGSRRVQHDGEEHESGSRKRRDCADRLSMCDVTGTPDVDELIVSQRMRDGRQTALLKLVHDLVDVRVRRRRRRHTTSGSGVAVVPTSAQQLVVILNDSVTATITVTTRSPSLAQG